MDITFRIPIVPQGKGRPRAVNFGKGRPRMITPRNTREFEAAVAWVASQYLPEDVIEGPIGIVIVSVIKRPKRLERARDPEGLIWAPVRPDADNVAKAVIDALEAFWKNDAQIVDLRSVKAYAEKTGQPRIYVRIFRPEAAPIELSDYGVNHG